MGKYLENNEMFVMTTRAFCGANKPLSVLAVLVLSFLELSSRDFPSQSPETNISQKGRSWICCIGRRTLNIFIHFTSRRLFHYLLSEKYHPGVENWVNSRNWRCCDVRSLSETFISHTHTHTQTHLDVFQIHSLLLPCSCLVYYWHIIKHFICKKEKVKCIWCWLRLISC